MNAGLQRSQSVPRHVAIIMDGNGRWARARNLPRTAGHKYGVDATRAIVEICAQRGVEILTLFAFSSENWQRPQSEVNTLMNLFLSTLRRESQKLAKNGIRLRFIGERSAFSSKLQHQIARAEESTATGAAMLLNIAANYGGRWDITQAACALLGDVLAGRLAVGDIGSESISKRLTTASLPDPDLFIRTGGEQRISNFLLWQLAYTELYFTEVLWPDFGETTLIEAFGVYARRQRRFGRTGEQIVEQDLEVSPNA